MSRKRPAPGGNRERAKAGAGTRQETTSQGYDTTARGYRQQRGRQP